MVVTLRTTLLLIILALLIGDQLYGIAGALLALPVSAVLRETVVYLRRHLVLEPWTTAVAGVGASAGLDLGPGGAPPGADAGADASGADAVPEPAERCPDCNALAGPGDAFCRACGSSLEPRVRTPG